MMLLFWGRCVVMLLFWGRCIVMLLFWGRCIVTLLFWGRCVVMLLFFSCTEQPTCPTLCMLFPGIQLLTALISQAIFIQCQGLECMELQLHAHECLPTCRSGNSLAPGTVSRHAGSQCCASPASCQTWSLCGSTGMTPEGHCNARIVMEAEHADSHGCYLIHFIRKPLPLPPSIIVKWPCHGSGSWMRPVTERAHVHFQVSPCRICGGQR